MSMREEEVVGEEPSEGGISATLVALSERLPFLFRSRTATRAAMIISIVTPPSKAAVIGDMAETVISLMTSVLAPLLSTITSLYE